ncbi:DeoR/GlpR family DNA-binding transcription regulator [Eubacteriales bacterium OttesenSCG-928-N14]|nr:DeoR/GlpR family DNA-binding transcription regulator [Eubacteriales bacterium OttesenSCG-928-N14]
MNKGVVRRNAIVERVVKDNYCSLKDLCAQFNVSESTIKRDLNILEQESRIHRVHGGAHPKYTESDVPIYSRRMDINRSEKIAIAKQAAELIKNGDTVFLDAGSTISFMLDFITAKRVTIFTNGVSIINAAFAHDYDFKINVISGELFTSQSLLLGVQTLPEIERNYFDKVFMSSESIDPSFGLLTTTYTESMYKEKLAERCDQLILCCDSSKIHTWKGNIKTVPFSNADLIITDSNLPEQMAAQIEQQGPRVILTDF